MSSLPPKPTPGPSPKQYGQPHDHEQGERKEDKSAAHPASTLSPRPHRPRGACTHSLICTISQSDDCCGCCFFCFFLLTCRSRCAFIRCTVRLYVPAPRSMIMPHAKPLVRLPAGPVQTVPRGGRRSALAALLWWKSDCSRCCHHVCPLPERHAGYWKSIVALRRCDPGQRRLV